MNDIQLVDKGNGKFDWKFGEFDVENVIGDQQLISACTHNIYLNKNELESDVYFEQGSDINKYLRLGMDDANIDAIITEIRTQCKKVDGVYDADVKVKKQDNTLLIEKIVLIKNNGGTVEIAIQK